MPVRPYVWLCACLVLGGACSIDRELGVASELNSATIDIVGDGAAATLSVQAEATFRVGENALAPQSFVPTSLEVYAGETLLSAFVPTGSDGGLLAPGEERSVSLSGGPETAEGADALCEGVARVRLVYRFAENTGVSTSPVFRDTEVETRDIRCE